MVIVKTRLQARVLKCFRVRGRKCRKEKKLDGLLMINNNFKASLPIIEKTAVFTNAV